MSEQREIKFRAWCDYGPGHTLMLYDRGDLSEFFDAADGCPIMQYTGLKDSTKWTELTEKERKRWVEAGNMPSQWNGKEIYEGDILHEKVMGRTFAHGSSWHNVMVDHYCFVVWEEYKWRVQDRSGGGTESIVNWNESGGVIGNIYENPELVEK